MRKTKYFNTYIEQKQWIEKNKNKYEIEILYINNGYCVEYKKLTIIDIN